MNGENAFELEGSPSDQAQKYPKRKSAVFEQTASSPGARTALLTSSRWPSNVATAFVRCPQPRE